jgi:hypothetical protein
MTTLADNDIIALANAGVTRFYYAQWAINDGATIANIITLAHANVTDFNDAQRAINIGASIADIITLHTAGVTEFYYAQRAINIGASIADIIALANAGVTTFYNAQLVINRGATIVEYCTPLAVTKRYKLRYYAYNQTYNAGCKSLTYAEAKEYAKTATQRGVKRFLAAIERHQKSLQEVTKK